VGGGEGEREAYPVFIDPTSVFVTTCAACTADTRRFSAPSKDDRDKMWMQRSTCVTGSCR
jgi:hypothetical protein